MKQRTFWRGLLEKVCDIASFYQKNMLDDFPPQWFPWQI